MSTHDSHSRTSQPQRLLPDVGLRLAHRLAVRLDGRSHADEASRQAVAILTAAADPARAGKLAPGAGEPAPLVVRLAVWALHRVDEDTMNRAERELDRVALADVGAPRPPATPATDPDRRVGTGRG